MAHRKKKKKREERENERSRRARATETRFFIAIRVDECRPSWAKPEPWELICAIQMRAIIAGQAAAYGPCVGCVFSAFCTQPRLARLEAAGSASAVFAGPQSPSRALIQARRCRCCCASTRGWGQVWSGPSAVRSRRPDTPRNTGVAPESGRRATISLTAKEKTEEDEEEKIKRVDEQEGNCAWMCRLRMLAERWARRWSARSATSLPPAALRPVPPVPLLPGAECGGRRMTAPVRAVNHPMILHIHRRRGEQPRDAAANATLRPGGERGSKCGKAMSSAGG